MPDEPRPEPDARGEPEPVARPRQGPDAGGRWAARWAAFKDSPFLPATVLVLILGAAAGLFAASYTYNMANPTPRRIPAAVVGSRPPQPQARAFVAGMEKALGASLDLKAYPSRAAALDAVEQQRVFTVLDLRDRNRGFAVDLSSASGQSVAEVLRGAASAVGRSLRVPVRVTDVNPLQRGDPRGLAIFYVSLASVVIGFAGALQLRVHARELGPVARIVFTLSYAMAGGFAIAAMVDWALGAVRLPFAESWAILALTMYTSGMVATMFATLVGRWAMLPTWGLMVILGNPSSGGAVSWPLLPSVLGAVGQWLPPGASVNAQHTAVYFGGHQHAFPFLVLGAWAAGATAVFWIWRHRHPGGRTRAAASADRVLGEAGTAASG